MTATDIPARSRAELPPVRQWRLHLGAHKTATTHLQQTLAAIRPRLAAAGVDALPVADVRAAWSGHMRAHLKRRNLAIWLSRAPAAEALQAAFAPLRAGPEVVLISEENLPGEAHAAAALPVYGDLTRRLRLLAALGRDAELELFLAIRSMDRFLPSAHAEALRHFPMPEGFAPVRAGAAARPPRWSALAGRIRAAMPRARLRVWRYEDYRDHAAEIAALVAGRPLAALPALPPPAETVSPSAAAVAEAEALPADLSFAARAEAVAAIYAAAPVGEGRPPFRPFDAAQAARLQDAYAADCAALAAQGVLVSFEAAGGDWDGRS